MKNVKLEKCIGKTIAGLLDVDNGYVVTFGDGTYCLVQAHYRWDSLEIETGWEFPLSEVATYPSRWDEAVMLGLFTRDEIGEFLRKSKEGINKARDERDRLEFARLKQKFGE